MKKYCIWRKLPSLDFALNFFSTLCIVWGFLTLFCFFFSIFSRRFPQRTLWTGVDQFIQSHRTIFYHWALINSVRIQIVWIYHGKWLFSVECRPFRKPLSQRACQLACVQAIMSWNITIRIHGNGNEQWVQKKISMQKHGLISNNRYWNEEHG